MFSKPFIIRIKEPIRGGGGLVGKKVLLKNRFM